MKKLIIGICVVALIALFAGRAWYLYTQKQTEKIDRVVKMGLILPMSGGSFDFIGPWSFDSAKIAEEVLNASGLYDFKIKIVLQDGKLAPKASIDAFNKLVAENVKAVLVMGDTPTHAVAQFTKDAKMPTFSISGMENLQDLSPYFFQMSIKNAYFMPKLAEYATKVKKIRKVAILHIKIPVALKTVEAFIQSVTQNGASVTAVESFSETATEARTQILKLLDTKPDALFIFGWNTAYVNAINYAREMGFAGPILTDLNVGSLLKMIKKKDNIFYATTTFFDSTDKYGYVQKFKAYRGFRGELK